MVGHIMLPLPLGEGSCEIAQTPPPNPLPQGEGECYFSSLRMRHKP